MTETIEKSLLDLDFASLTQRTFTPSPAAWEDEVLYFLLLDRFSDGNEKDGYGIQNFLDVDPHFGTREEFRDFVRAAHAEGIYVILDIVAHHTGNVFSYDPDRYTTHDPASGRWYNDPRWDGKPYGVKGFNDRDGRPTLPFGPPDGDGVGAASRAALQAPLGSRGLLEQSWPDGAIWPREFQRANLFLRKGHITNWEYYPEYAQGDMFGLKTLDLQVQWDGQYRQASSALACLGLAYCFWIAYADLDGFRIDAAKHMGEIEDVPGKLERMVTGYTDPADYFSLFRNWILAEKRDAPAGYRWYRDQVVTRVDDHDQVRKGGAKWRFCGDGRFRDLAFNVLAVQLTTMGIPCVCYGSEQGCDSGGRPNGSDLVLREIMFGGLAH